MTLGGNLYDPALAPVPAKVIATVPFFFKYSPGSKLTKNTPTKDSQHDGRTAMEMQPSLDTGISIDKVVEGTRGMIYGAFTLDKTPFQLQKEDSRAHNTPQLRPVQPGV